MVRWQPFARLDFFVREKHASKPEQRFEPADFARAESRRVWDVSESKHAKSDHKYERNAALPEWHGWHAARRGLGTNLNHLGVDDSVIQRILRHSSIATTQEHYILPDNTDKKQALEKIEAEIAALRAKQRELATKAAQQDIALLPRLESESKIGLPS